MAESKPDLQPETIARPAKAVLNATASTSNLVEGPESDPDQYGWGV